MGGETLFISDLHLDGSRPRIIDLCERFLLERAARADALYVLGDLFEYWVGDDDPAEDMQRVIRALRSITDQGVATFFVHGNRDFLIGAEFSARSGVTLLPELSVIDLYGQPTLILHGDTLCTDDTAYQELRVMLRNPAWQQQFLALPLSERHAQARALRDQSKEAVSDKAEAIMDVNQQTVEQTLLEHGVRHMIHGHTHRPAIHDFTLADKPAQRIVLGDWYDQGSVLSCTPQGPTLETL
ncbi:MAG: UDP-2,3-diacylglucosamine diphosphatase [Gammaproteobacteria bacterium]|jgi:UDP-2,3-diacylglucosamine hydrolase